MNKEEILAKARTENKGKDIAELEVQSKAHGIAGAAVLLLCATVELVASLYGYRSSQFFRIMFCSYNAFFGIVRYIAGKRHGASQEKGSLWLLFGLLMAGFTVAFLCFLFRDMKAGTA